MTERQRRLALACCLGAGFATLLDSVVLSFAVPSMTAALGASTGQVQWVLASYSLTFGLGLVPGGRLGDAFGRRGLFVAGLVVFVVGGFAAAGAGNVWWVVAGRLVQGFGAGLISAQVLGVIQDLFVGARRVRALAAYTSAGAAAALVGPLAAAAVLSLLPPAWGWRGVLLLNVPFAVATLVLALRCLPTAARGGRRPDVDVPGVVMLGALAVLATLPVIDPGAHPAALVLVAVAVPVLILVLAGWERRYGRRGKVPLFAPALVRQTGFLAGNGVALLWFGSVISHGTVLTLYLIQGAGQPALAVALVLVPSAVSRIVASSVAPRVFHRRGTRTVPVALLGQVACLVGIAVAARGLEGGEFLVVVAAIEVLLGFASGLVEPPLRAITLGFAPAGFHGVAASFLQLTQRLSATFCVAVASGLLFRGAQAVVTPGSFVVSLLFCATLLVLAAGIACTPWFHASDGGSTMRDDAGQGLARAAADLSSPPSQDPQGSPRRRKECSMASDRAHHPIVAVALEGAGWHPAAWREDAARPEALTDGAYWVDLTRRAEAGVVDLVTFEDSFGVPADPRDDPAGERTDRVRVRLDAELVAARVAPATTHVGLVPVVTTIYTEPFHVAKALATLDHTSRGRAGWQVRVSGLTDETSLTGRRDFPTLTIEDYLAGRGAEAIGERFDEAAAVVDTVRALWDSWEVDAEIRDAETRRFIDRDKVHRVDIETPWFSVRGPSITPRPPQGQPVVTALAHATVPYELAARSADVVFVTPHDDSSAASILAEVRTAEDSVGRTGEPLRVVADLAVVLDAGGETGAARLARLDSRAGGWATDARIVTGSARDVADLVEAWTRLGYDGVRFRPAVLPDDLDALVADVLPELRRRGLARTAYDAPTLRGLLGLPTDVPNRFAAAV